MICLCDIPRRKQGRRHYSGHVVLGHLIGMLKLNDILEEYQERSQSVTVLVRQQQTKHRYRPALVGRWDFYVDRSIFVIITLYKSLSFLMK